MSEGIVEKIDKSKAVRAEFNASIKNLKTFTPDDYRDFVIHYFYTQQEKENMLNIIGLAEIANKNINEWKAFQRLFKNKAYLEYSRKIHNRFLSEESNIGFMM